MVTATESIDVAHAVHETVLRVGGLFTTSPLMTAAAQHHGMSSSALCLRGRVGVVGRVDPANATALLGICPPLVVRSAWQSTRRVSAHEAASTYAEVCAAWGHEQLSDTSKKEVIVELAEYVVDTADLHDLPLAVGWRDWPRPADPVGRLAHTLMLLREMLYGLDVAAISGSGLTVTVALLASHVGTDGLRCLGWSQKDINDARYEAAHIADLDLRWARVRLTSDLRFSSCLGVLDVHAQRTLINGLARIDAATRLPYVREPRPST